VIFRTFAPVFVFRPGKAEKSVSEISHRSSKLLSRLSQNLISRDVKNVEEGLAREMKGKREKFIRGTRIRRKPATRLTTLLKPPRERGIEIRPRHARVIGIFSCKGGVGKTTTVANLGMSLTERWGPRLLTLDANLGAPNLGLHFGELTPKITIHDVISTELPIEHAILEVQGVRTIFGSIAYEDEVHLVDLRELISPLRKKFKVILVDSAPGIGSEVVAALKACNEIIIVTDPYVPTIASTLKTFRVAERYKVPILGVVVNRVAGDPFELPIKEIRRALGWPIMGVIPEDKKVREATAAGIPVIKYYPKSKAAKEFRRLAETLANRLRKT
jgi:septum site-determining protein MinD